MDGVACPLPPYDDIPQPPPDCEPFNFPLICLATADSGSIEGLRLARDDRLPRLAQADPRHCRRSRPEFRQRRDNARDCTDHDVRAR
jgi:hypothetical protein